MSADSSPTRIPESDRFVSRPLVSYDIPLDDLPVQQRKELPSIQTTVLNNSAIEPEEKNWSYGNDDVASHGFFFGSQSTQDMSLWDSKENGDDFDEDDDMEDEGIHEIFGIYRPSNDPNMWIRESNRSWKPSPEVTPRHALSKRIDNVGIIGQNIALAHRIGVLSEDATLTPKAVILQITRFVITEDSPVQTDVTWSKPANASTFASLIYDVEVSLPHNGDKWTEVASVRQPVFRFYHTDDKLFIGKHQVIRGEKDVTIGLRVRCHGELRLPDSRGQHWVVSPYSKIVEVIFIGYAGYVPLEVQQTDL